MPPEKGFLSARIVVWFDQPSACICFGNRAGLEDGEALPPERTYRIPWVHADAIFEGVMNAALGESFRNEAEDFDKIMYGVQKLLDSRALQAFEVTEQFRLARSKAAGGGVVNSMSGDVIVHAERYGKLVTLLDKVRGMLDGVAGPGQVAGGLLEDLSVWIEDSGLSEDR